MSSITVTGVPTVKAPRGAMWAARGAAAVWGVLSRWLADRQDRSVALQAAVDAAQVRALARRFAHVDPGFAADLQAAADRHEALNGAR
jgi:hypothetical protein